VVTEAVYYSDPVAVAMFLHSGRSVHKVSVVSAAEQGGQMTAQEMGTLYCHFELSVAILPAVEGQVEEPVVMGCDSAPVAAAGIAQVVLSRRHLATQLESRIVCSSVYSIYQRPTQTTYIYIPVARAWHTHIPILGPLRQVRMVYSPIITNVLTWSHYHILRGDNIYNGRVARVVVRNPYLHWEAVRRASKCHRECAVQLQQ
jgi:hypothetical protein